MEFKTFLDNKFTAPNLLPLIKLQNVISFVKKYKYKLKEQMKIHQVLHHLGKTRIFRALRELQKSFKTAFKGQTLKSLIGLLNIFFLSLTSDLTMLLCLHRVVHYFFLSYFGNT